MSPKSQAEGTLPLKGDAQRSGGKAGLQQLLGGSAGRLSLRSREDIVRMSI